MIEKNRPVCGWENIHRMFLVTQEGKEIMCLRAFKARGPELKAAGVLWQSKRGNTICCWPSEFIAYISEITKNGRKF